MLPKYFLIFALILVIVVIFSFVLSRKNKLESEHFDQHADNKMYIILLFDKYLKRNPTADEITKYNLLKEQAAIEKQIISDFNIKSHDTATTSQQVMIDAPTAVPQQPAPAHAPAPTPSPSPPQQQQPIIQPQVEPVESETQLKSTIYVGKSSPAPKKVVVPQAVLLDKIQSIQEQLKNVKAMVETANPENNGKFYWFL